MSNPIISPKARNEFREYFVGSTLRLIQEAFDGGEVRCDLDYEPPVSGQRRALVEQYYHSVDWSNWRSVSRVVKVYENELRDLYAPPDAVYSWSVSGDEENQEHRKKIANKLLYWLRQDGFEWVSNRLVRSTGTPVLEDLASAPRTNWQARIWPYRFSE